MPEVWDLSPIGDPQARLIIEQAITACRFDWSLLLPGLQKGTEWSEPGKTMIPVEVADLSRFAQARASADVHDHDHNDSALTHLHVEQDGDRAHGIATRERVLGLAWYSGKVSVDQSLVSDPLLMQEVFLAEGAHMVDFFYISPEQREAIFRAYHGGDTTAHDHGWFEETGNQDYWSWVGESFMGGFIQAYSDIEPTLDAFVHKSTDEIGRQIRDILTPTPAQARFFGVQHSKVFHDREHGLANILEFHSYDEAVAAGRRPCSVCRPVA